MSSDNLDTRNEGYAMLGAIGQPWATELLIEGLANEHGEDREQAIVAMGHTGDPEMANRIVRFHNTQGLVFATLEALGELGDTRTLPAAKKQTEHEEKQVRLHAAVAAWKLGDAETAIPVLEPLVADEDPAFRGLVAEKLASVEADQAKQWLVALAQDEDKVVRLSALRSLATTATDADAALFLTASADGEYEIATVALNVLSGLQASPEQIEQLEPLMEDKNPYVALSAAHAILALKAGPEQAAP
jgi:HEAT repeat protein